SPLADPVLADLELGLDHQGEVGVGGTHAEQRVEHQPQRDERQVPHDDVHGAADHLDGQVADVGAVVDGDPVVAAQLPGQLAVADVHRHHLRGTLTQEDVGEASRGCTRVQTAAPLHGEPE